MAPSGVICALYQGYQERLAAATRRDKRKAAAWEEDAFNAALEACRIWDDRAPHQAGVVKTPQEKEKNKQFLAGSS